MEEHQHEQSADASAQRMALQHRTTSLSIEETMIGITHARSTGLQISWRLSALLHCVPYTDVGGLLTVKTIFAKGDDARCSSTRGWNCSYKTSAAS